MKRPEVTPSSETEQDGITELLLEKLNQYWGYGGFRPLQREAMSLVMQKRDSLIVLPTGGGKSLCYQVPALCRDGLALVVSPLISLMKDQVDSLQAVGISAACINSMQTAREKNEVAAQIRQRQLKLLYIAPERLMQEKTIEFLREAGVSFVAIDEAHCISQWGHDFRPEYRQLSRLKEIFPGADVHGYTATATDQVRTDIVEQLKHKSPEVLVGSFDRPNLHYRVERRSDSIAQIRRILDRHKGESGVIYCISRRNVESTSDALNQLGHRTLPYHAGMPDEARRRSQDAFIDESIEIIVATVAFGMGIDKSNVRFVIHAEMPRSLENYQQESGRAGRDGLEAECTLLYSSGDADTWEFLLKDTEDPAVLAAARSSLTEMQRYCISTHCRHQLLVAHFGQSLETTNCGACDICLNEMQPVADAQTVAQKILSSVIRQGQRFGGAYTAQVLRGSRSKRILENRHDSLSTWGLMKDESESQIRNWIDQLLSQGFLAQAGEFNCLEVTTTGRQLLKGELNPKLLRVREGQQAAAAVDQWSGVNRELFDELRSMRTRISVQKKVPPYVIFSDATLRDLARQRPTRDDTLAQVFGIGRRRLEEYGPILLKTIGEWCEQHHVSGDVGSRPSTSPASVRRDSSRETVPTVYAELFEQGLSIEAVCLQLDRASNTVAQHLERYIRLHRITEIDPWVPASVQQKILRAIAQTGNERLKPLFEFLNGEFSYDQLRLVSALWDIRLEANPDDESLHAE
jgi:ATP-dependent DNA helicase RecQ